MPSRRWQVSNPVCGDVMKLWVKVGTGAEFRTRKFKAQGCSAAIATSSYATEMLIGMTVAEARADHKGTDRGGARRIAGVQDSLQRTGVRRHQRSFEGILE